MIDNSKFLIDPDKCGFASNAAAHRRRGQPVCGPCRRAEREAERQRRIIRNGGVVTMPHHDSHCPSCGRFLKVKWSGMECVACKIGVCA